MTAQPAAYGGGSCPFPQGPRPTSHTCHTSHTCSLSCHLIEPCFSSGPAVPGSDFRRKRSWSYGRRSWRDLTFLDCHRGQGLLKPPGSVPKGNIIRYYNVKPERGGLFSLHPESYTQGQLTLWGSFWRAKPAMGLYLSLHINLWQWAEQIIPTCSLLSLIQHQRGFCSNVLASVQIFLLQQFAFDQGTTHSLLPSWWPRTTTQQAPEFFTSRTNCSGHSECEVCSSQQSCSGQTPCYPVKQNSVACVIVCMYGVNVVCSLNLLVCLCVGYFEWRMYTWCIWCVVGCMWYLCVEYMCDVYVHDVYVGVLCYVCVCLVCCVHVVCCTCVHYMWSVWCLPMSTCVNTCRSHQVFSSITLHHIVLRKDCSLRQKPFAWLGIWGTLPRANQSWDTRGTSEAEGLRTELSNP